MCVVAGTYASNCIQCSTMWHLVPQPIVSQWLGSASEPTIIVPFQFMMYSRAHIIILTNKPQVDVRSSFLLEYFFWPTDDATHTHKFRTGNEQRKITKKETTQYAFHFVATILPFVATAATPTGRMCRRGVELLFCHLVCACFCMLACACVCVCVCVNDKRWK